MRAKRGHPFRHKSRNGCTQSRGQPTPALRWRTAIPQTFAPPLHPRFPLGPKGVGFRLLLGRENRADIGLEALVERPQLLAMLLRDLTHLLLLRLRQVELPQRETGRRAS